VGENERTQDLIEKARRLQDPLQKLFVTLGNRSRWLATAEHL